MKLKFVCAASVLSAVVIGSPAFARESSQVVEKQSEPESSEDSEDSGASDDASVTKAPARKPTETDPFGSLMNRPGGLTSDEAARQAAEYSREAVVSQQQAKAADALTDQIIYKYLPRVTLTAQYTRQSTPDGGAGFGDGNLVGTTEAPGPLAAGAQTFAIDASGFNFNALPNNYYLNAGVVVPLSDYLLNMTQALNGASANKKSAQLSEQAARLSAAANARLTYYEWVRARLRMAEATRSTDRARAQLENLEKLKEAGRVAQADVLQQDAFVASTELGLRRAKTQEAVARETLHVAMTGGKGKTPRFTIGEDVMGEGRARKLGSTQELHQEAVSKRLELRALENTAYAIDQEAAVQRAHSLPRLEAFGNLTYANPNPRYQPPQAEWNASWDVGLRMVWTLNDFGANRARARSNESDAAQIRAQKAQVADALRTEVVSSRQMLDEARLAKTSASRGVKAAEAAHSARVLLFDNGRATSLDLLQAETALVTARLNLVDAHIALRQAEVRLDHAVGRDVPAASLSK